ncbi:D-2-hydroxyacid dehydrogenase [Saliphagus infecundisoli]|uniref:D-2-hydroxyacid dehydrogenase n=1 Tax=Saliphagus infecundisoli TaxID=1849069 RepID=A0ABD5QHB7_9EURY|nr:D-2-hydroxyacid dehydrogenase [Saliphagus infecundisoli]
MEIDRLGIHDSVAAVFPPERLREFLASETHGGIDVAVIGDDGLGGVDGVVTLEHRDAFRDLEWIHSIQAGIDRFPLEALDERGVVLTNSTGIHGRSIGETVAGYLLAFARRLHDHVAAGERREWNRPEWDEAFTLSGTTACIVGTGTLGRGVADVVGSLGVRTVGVRRSPDSLPEFEEMYATETLHEAIAGPEFVVATVPLTADTEGLFDRAAFEAMAPEARFVNVARGGVVDEPALVAALESGSIAGAALDVFETEPLPESSPLWGFEEVIVTPHCGAYTRDYYRDVGEIVADNVVRIERDGEFRNRVV